jgi:mono/diheme cytochrome c family protein
MRMTGNVVVALVLVIGAAASASAGQGRTAARDTVTRDTVLGRMVAARVDAPSVVTASTPRNSFILNCAGCHGLDGAGSTLGNVPDLRRLGAFLTLGGGRDYVIKVPGVMGSGLDDRQVADVANWVLANIASGSMPAGQGPYEAAEVARARRAPLKDVAAERRRLTEEAKRVGIALY